MGKRLPGKIWERHRVAILRLYLDDGERLEDVRSIMWREHKFQASVAAYKNKFKRWEVRKRETPTDPSSDLSSASSIPYLPPSDRLLGSILPFPSIQSLEHATAFPFSMADPDSTTAIPEHATPRVEDDIAIPHQELEDFFSTFPLSPSGLNLENYLETDFNDNEVQETSNLVAQLSALIQSSVNAGGFAASMVEESLEERFSQYEARGKMQLLERVLAADILLLGSQSPMFYHHAKRFSEMANKTTSELPIEGTSIFGRALQMTMNMASQSGIG